MKSTTPKFRHNRPRKTRGQAVGTVISKGGTGKTTETAVLAYEATKKGLRVVTIDLDHQCNLTTRMGYSSSGSPGEGSIRTALHAAYGDWIPEDALRALYSIEIELLGKPISIIPGDFRFEQDLAALDTMASTDPGIIHRLRQVVDILRPYYDLIAIDAPPTNESLLIDLILWAVDIVNIPIDGWDAVDGACLLLDRISLKQVEREAMGVRPLKVFLTIPHLTTNYTETPAWLQFLEERFTKHLVRDYVRHSIQAQRSCTPGKVLSNIGGNVRKDYKRLLNTLFRKVYDPTIPEITSWMKHEGLTPLSIRSEAVKMRRAAGRLIGIVPVKTVLPSPETVLNPPHVGESLADLMANGGF